VRLTDKTKTRKVVAALPTGKPRSKHPELYGVDNTLLHSSTTTAASTQAQLFDFGTSELVDDAQPEPDTIDSEPEVNIDPIEAVVLPPAPPKPERELTAEQRRIRELEDQLAKVLGSKEPDIELEAPKQPGNRENILIHILEDGFTALGHVWFRGQEIEFEPGSPAYNDTVDRTGWSWLALRDDEFGQVERWGKIMFRSGPWPGKSYTDAAGVPYDQVRDKNGNLLPPPGEDELAAAAAAERKRNRAAPRLPLR
jgi:hypothetical protein